MTNNSRVFAGRHCFSIQIIINGTTRLVQVEEYEDGFIFIIVKEGEKFTNHRKYKTGKGAVAAASRVKDI